MTSPNQQTYHGVDITANKRFGHRWQMSMALTLQKAHRFFDRAAPTFAAVSGSNTTSWNPTGYEFVSGFNPTGQNGVTMLFKANGAYQFPLDITASAKLKYRERDAWTGVRSAAQARLSGSSNVPRGEDLANTERQAGRECVRARGRPVASHRPSAR